MEGLEEELSLVFKNDGIKGFVQWLDTANVSSQDLINTLEDLQNAGNLQIQYRNPNINNNNINNNNNNNNNITSWKDKINSFFTAPKDTADDTTTELADNMLGLAKSLTQNIGVGGEVVNGITGVIGGMVGLTSGITAVTAVITAIMAVLKAQNEYANAGLNAARWGMDEDKLKVMANQYGIDYKELLKASSYAGKAGMTMEDIETAIYLGHGDEIEMIKAMAQFKQGNAGAIKGMLAGTEISNYANEALLDAYAITGNTTGLRKVLEGNWDAHGAFSTRFYNEQSDYINRGQKEITRFMNGVGNIIDSNNIFATYRNSKGEEIKPKTQKVEVVNSIMLDQNTIDNLTKLREHQYLINVDLQHTTPINNYNINTEIGGQVNNADELSDALASKIQQINNTGAVVNNVGGY